VFIEDEKNGEDPIHRAGHQKPFRAVTDQARGKRPPRTTRHQPEHEKSIVTEFSTVWIFKNTTFGRVP